MLKVYVIMDKVEGTLVTIGTAKTSGGFIRHMLSWLRKFNPNFIDEYELYEIGDFNESDITLSPSRVLCSWSDYANPEILVEKKSV